MGEGAGPNPQWGGDVAGSVNPPVAHAAQTAIGDDARIRCLNIAGRKVECLEVGAPAGSTTSR